MLFFTILKVALRSLWGNKLRSFLAVLGIIIGVGAVISMLALAAGARRSIIDRISAMGTNLLIVRPGKLGMAGVMSGTQQNLTLEDAEAIVKEVSGIRQLAPVVGGNAQLKYFNKNTRVSVIGTSITYLPARGFEVEQGRAFTEMECDRLARVALLGPLTARNLFAADDPLGATFKLNGTNFTCVGVLKAKGDQGWFNPDDQAIIPYSTAMKLVYGLSSLREIDIECAEGSDTNQVQADTAAVLRRRHRLGPDIDDDFDIRNQAEVIETMKTITGVLTVLLGGIAGISLLVGGIGIMNIMLVTVTERTREIGVRKAIGAKNRDILLQFLIEAVVMSALGGVIGIATGLGLAQLVELLFDFKPLVEPNSILLALIFSAAVGIFFGFYPARRAAKLDPIEALRYE